MRMLKKSVRIQSCSHQCITFTVYWYSTIICIKVFIFLNEGFFPIFCIQIINIIILCQLNVISMHALHSLARGWIYSGFPCRNGGGGGCGYDISINFNYNPNDYKKGQILISLALLQPMQYAQCISRSPNMEKNVASQFISHLIEIKQYLFIIVSSWRVRVNSQPYKAFTQRNSSSELKLIWEFGDKTQHIRFKA